MNKILCPINGQFMDNFKINGAIKIYLRRVGDLAQQAQVPAWQAQHREFDPKYQKEKICK